MRKDWRWATCDARCFFVLLSRKMSGRAKKAEMSDSGMTVPSSANSEKCWKKRCEKIHRIGYGATSVGNTNVKNKKTHTEADVKLHLGQDLGLATSL